MILIDGKKIQKDILEEVRAGVAALDFQPVFCDILVGDDPASAQYVRMKARMAESVGMRFHGASFPASITTEELLKEISKINEIPDMCGIIVQLPLPEGIDRRRALDSIDPALDVDCLGTEAGSLFYAGKEVLGFPTALACVKLLDSIGVPLSGKNIVVLGQGELVGKPVAALLGFRGLSYTTVRSKTENREEIIKNADVIISGIGKGKFLTGDMVKDGVILIDAGTSESDSGIVGDIDLESVKEKAGYVSPVPGGVGPVTVAMLLFNVLKVAQRKAKK